MKNFKLVFAIAACIVVLSSCKKSDTSNVSVLGSHKWSLTSSTTTFSDSGSITHNELAGTCIPDVYVEFRDYTTSSPKVRQAYTYDNSLCAGYSLPSIRVTGWDIDNDNANLLLNADATDGTGGQWYTINTLNGSSLVIQRKGQRVIGNTGSPNYNSIFDTYTTITTYTAK